MNMNTLTDAQLHFLLYRRDLDDMEIDAVVREQEYRDWVNSPRNTVEWPESHTPTFYTPDAGEGTRELSGPGRELLSQAIAEQDEEGTS
jgi:hypothetical protein